MTTDFNKFMADTKKEIEKAQKEQLKKGREVVMYAYNEIVLNSPVKDGTFVNNHFISRNSQVDTTTDETSSRSEVIGSKANEVNSLKLNDGDAIYIQNNLSYANYLESGNSNQAPKGVYGIAEQATKRFMKRK